MAPENEAPYVKLTPEAKAELERLEGSIKRAEQTLVSLEKMDIDTTALRAELEHHKKIRQVLLEDFT
jgi:hypothetical protein